MEARTQGLLSRIGKMGKDEVVDFKRKISVSPAGRAIKDALYAACAEREASFVVATSAIVVTSDFSLGEVG